MVSFTYLLPLFLAILPTSLGQSSAECKLGADDNHVVVAGQINTKGLDYVMETIKLQAGTMVKNLTIPDQKISQSGVDVNVTGIKIEYFVSPAFSYTILPPSSIKINVKGGDFKVCASFIAKQWYIPNGGLCVWSENKKGVEVEVTAKVTINDKKQLSLETSGCKLVVPIDLKVTGGIAAVANVISGIVEKIASSQAQTQVCSLMDKAVKTTVKGMLEELPTSFKVNNLLGMGYTFHGITFHSGGVRATLGINATVGQKRGTTLPLTDF